MSPKLAKVGLRLWFRSVPIPSALDNSLMLHFLYSSAIRFSALGVANVKLQPGDLQLLQLLSRQPRSALLEKQAALGSGL